MQTTLLAIETSCDETAVALSVDGKVVNEMVLSQEIHNLYGGVVPELAARSHEQHLSSLVDTLLQQSFVRISEIHAVAFTQGPGLLGALLVGCAWAKAFAWAREIPLIAVDHIQSHVLSHFIEEPRPNFPFLSLVASGGHTQLIYVDGPLEMELLGETLDDAVGEAFDKVAKMMGLPYPGGPTLDAEARAGNPNAFSFPRSEVPGLNYSFSGLKTAFLYFLKKKVAEEPNFVANHLADICASVEHTLVEMLMEKLIEAQRYFQMSQICVAGGVAANSALRQALQHQSKEDGWQLFIPKMKHCTDNAAMVASAATFLYELGQTMSKETVPYARRRTSLSLDYGHRKQKGKI